MRLQLFCDGRELVLNIDGNGPIGDLKKVNVVWIIVSFSFFLIIVQIVAAELQVVTSEEWNPADVQFTDKK
jgi:hypothetical protein